MCHFSKQIVDWYIEWKTNISSITHSNWLSSPLESTTASLYSPSLTDDEQLSNTKKMADGEKEEAINLVSKLNYFVIFMSGKIISYIPLAWQWMKVMVICDSAQIFVGESLKIIYRGRPYVVRSHVTFIELLHICSIHEYRWVILCLHAYLHVDWQICAVVLDSMSVCVCMWIIQCSARGFRSTVSVFARENISDIWFCTRNEQWTGGILRIYGDYILYIGLRIKSKWA